MFGLFNKKEDRSAATGNIRVSTFDNLVNSLGLLYTSGNISNDPVASVGVNMVYACVNRICGTVSSLPLMLYKRTGDGRMRATKHPLYKILHFKPNDRMTSADFRSAMQFNLTLTGNAYALIYFNRAGEVSYLDPIPSPNVNLLDDGNYEISEKGAEKKVFPPSRILHLRGMTSNGVEGINTLTSAMRSIKLARTIFEDQLRFFDNGARPGGVMTHPGKLSEEASERMRKQLENKFGGINSHKTMLLEEGMKYEAWRSSNEDLQLIDLLKHQNEEIARVFQIPLPLVGSLDKSTFNNNEQMSLDYIKRTIQPILVRWEQALWDKLLNDAEKDEYYFEFLIDGELRGDQQTRYAAYQLGLNNGFLSPNEVRKMENLDPIDGGDQYFRPLNLGSLNEKPKENEPKTQPQPPEKEENLL